MYRYVKDFDFIGSIGLTKRIFFILVILTTFSGYYSFSEELVYGTEIKPITYTDIDKTPITAPQKGQVTVLFFFNIDRVPHQQVVSELNFIYINLLEEKKKVWFACISNGDDQKFQDIKKRYNLKLNLVNDADKIFLSLFDYKCGVCNRVIIIDKNRLLRYNASYVDFYFIKSIVERHEKENKIGEKL